MEESRKARASNLCTLVVLYLAWNPQSTPLISFGSIDLHYVSLRVLGTLEWLRKEETSSDVKHVVIAVGRRRNDTFSRLPEHLQHPQQLTETCCSPPPVNTNHLSTYLLSVVLPHLSLTCLSHLPFPYKTPKPQTPNPAPNTTTSFLGKT